MDNDPPVECIVVDSFFDSHQPECKTFLTPVSFTGEVKSETAFQTPELIGKPGSEDLPRITAVCNQGIEKEFAIFHIQHK